MSIVAKIEVEDEGILPIGSKGFGSKALATFTTPLSDYCHRFENRKVSTEIIEWFSELESEMTENLCLIDHVTYGAWGYSEDEYEQYVDEIRATHEQAISQNPPISKRIVGQRGYEEYLHKVMSGDINIMSKEQFIQTCRQIEQKWVDANSLRSVVNDLVRALGKIQPDEVWWYNERDSLPDFKALGKTLSDIINRGIHRVRIYLS